MAPFTVVFTVDTETPVSFAPTEELYGIPQTEAIIDVSRRHGIPVTWLLYTSLEHTATVPDYYLRNFVPHIPEGHEFGMHCHFDTTNLPRRDRITEYKTDPAVRGAIIRDGAAALRERGFRPVSHRAGCLCLENSDITALEEAGIRMDSSPCPGVTLGNHAGHGDYRGMELRTPYHPSYEDLTRCGDAGLLIAPVASIDSQAAVLEYGGFELMKRIADLYAENRWPLVYVMHDAISGGEEACRFRQSEVLDALIPYLRAKGARFKTMTQLWEENQL